MSAEGRSQAREQPDGQVARLTVVAQPFRHHRRLRDFIAAVCALPGVHGATLRQFAQSGLTLEVLYMASLPLDVRLGDLRDFPARITSAPDGTIRMALAEAKSWAYDHQDRP